MTKSSSIEWRSEIARLRRSRQFFNACNRAIIRAVTETDLLQAICQLMVDQGDYQLAWVGYGKNDSGRTIQPIVHVGRSTDRELIHAILADSEFWQCPIGQAMRSGEPYLVQDIDQGTGDAPWVQILQQSGYQALISLPLIEQNRVFGTLNLYAEIAHCFEAEEVQLLNELAADLSYGVTKLRADEVRAQAEQALQQSYAQYNNLVNRIPIGVYKFQMSTDGTMEFIYVSPCWGEMNQLDPAAVIADSSLAFDLIHPDEIDVFIRLNQQAREHLNQFIWEGRVIIGGEVRWWHIESAPTQQANGDIIWDGIQYDITEVVQAKQEQERLLGETIAASLEMAASEQRYASLAAAVPVGIFRTDAIGNCLYVNDRWSQISGLSIEDALGTGWVNGLHPDDQELIQAEWYLAAQEKRLFQLEYRFQRSDGRVSWVYGQASAELNEQGEVLGYVGTITDISDRKAAEAERLQAEQVRQELNLLEAIFDIVMAGYWEWDIPRHRHYMSYGWKRMLGYEADELPTRPETWQELIFPEDLSVVMHHFEQHVQSRGQIPYYNEVRYRHKDGSTVWLICSGRVIEWDDAGNPLRMIGCHIDISDRKAIEAQLQQLNQELNRSNQDLEQFAYIASHDLQEPLRAIISYSQLLAENYGAVLSEPLAQESLSFIIDGGQRMRQLIQDLLAYSRIGSQTLDRRSVDMNHSLAEILQNLQVQITESQATITSDHLPILYADRTQLIQLLQNLINNALKFRRVTPPQIHIGTMILAPTVNTASQKPSSPEHYVIFVRDNGIGIKPQYLEQIFDIFRRLHTRQQFPGTGIGLAICKKIVERHGGEMWATSEWGEGSTFFFTLSANPDASQI
jgi:PAS domain S-box-containing protein